MASDSEEFKLWRSYSALPVFELKYSPQRFDIIDFQRVVSFGCRTKFHAHTK
jgi:hypothetical protein